MEADYATTDPIDNERQGNPGHQSIFGAVLSTIFIRAHIVAL